MPATQPSMELHALCHEHHVEMRLRQILMMSKGGDVQTLAYACTEPDCYVHYDSSRGYFMLSPNANTSELDMLPKVRCSLDGAPMYLVQVKPMGKSSRLWRCPQCDAKRTNGEGLIGEAMLDDLTGKAKEEP